MASKWRRALDNKIKVRLGLLLLSCSRSRRSEVRYTAVRGTAVECSRCPVSSKLHVVQARADKKFLMKRAEDTVRYSCIRCLWAPDSFTFRPPRLVNAPSQGHTICELPSVTALFKTGLTTSVLLGACSCEPCFGRCSRILSCPVQ